MSKVILAEIRKQRGFSANELGRRAGVAASTIRRIENGDPQHIESIEKIARALECAPNTIDTHGLYPAASRRVSPRAVRCL
jgi:transcriptional regulator with XRE-family HTH domain